MDTYKKWEIFETYLSSDQLFAAHVLTNYNGFNHETLDHLANEFDINWDEHEEAEEDA